MIRMEQQLADLSDELLSMEADLRAAEAKLAEAEDTILDLHQDVAYAREQAADAHALAGMYRDQFEALLVTYEAERMREAA